MGALGDVVSDMYRRLGCFESFIAWPTAHLPTWFSYVDAPPGLDQLAIRLLSLFTPRAGRAALAGIALDTFLVASTTGLGRAEPHVMGGSAPLLPSAAFVSP